NDARKSDPTDLVLSAAKLPQYKFFGGQPIDINFGTDTIKNHKSEITALIKVYLANGGIQFQVNSLSSKLLRDATDNPEKYPNLVVRIGGYSLLFNSISQKSKEEFIERVAKEGY
ncbi:MAG: glycine radical domain-containing protein, partial [Firmicutes bacterium]|nr:glycine radical domain-containing protein [Bacillota bacterium]